MGNRRLKKNKHKAPMDNQRLKKNKQKGPMGNQRLQKINKTHQWATSN